jgi:Transposase family tnp2
MTVQAQGAGPGARGLPSCGNVSPYLLKFGFVEDAAVVFRFQSSANPIRMPATRRSKVQGRKGHSGATPKCRCKSHCTVYDSRTGRYIGSGELVTPATLARHRRDDRLRALLRVPPTERVPEAPAHDVAFPSQNWVDLISQELDYLAELPCLIAGQRLKFRATPNNTDYRTEWPDDFNIPLAGPNSGAQPLVPGEPSNKPYLHKETRLWEIHQLLKTFPQDPHVEELGDLSYTLLQALERDKEGQWESQREPTRRATYFNTGQCDFQSHRFCICSADSFLEDVFQPRHRPSPASVQTSTIAILLLHNVYFASRRTVQVQLAGLKDIFETFPSEQARHSHAQARPQKLPKHPEALSVRYRLDPITQKYIVCSRCHCLYAYRLAAPGADLIPPPPLCAFKSRADSAQCNEPLWRKSDRGPYGLLELPRKVYVHQDLKSWLGRMVLRPGMENFMESCPVPDGAHDQASIPDIWLAKVFPALRDVNNRRFYPGPGTELRLVFSLSVDGFDSFGGKIAKQKASSTGIWMVLLNLPPHLRYLPQNMYTAGVIPGPKKPSNEEINHYMQLVVNDFKDFWDPGVTYSRTHKHREGRLARALVVPLVCDMLGARQIIGQPGTTTAHYFCTGCDLDIDDINLLDPTQWPAKDLSDLRRFSQLHRDAQSENDAKEIFEGSGCRWTPLWELVYWDPVQFTVIDSMHALDLNVIQTHCRNILQIDITQNSGQALRPAAGPKRVRVINDKAELAALSRFQETVFDNASDMPLRLIQFHRRILFSFCLDYNIFTEGSNVVSGTRWVLAKNILFWVCFPLEFKL